MCRFCRQAFREGFPEEVASFICSYPKCSLRKSPCRDLLDVLETQQEIKWCLPSHEEAWTVNT